MRRALLLVVLGLPLFASASAHGPVFGLATPTNSQGEWSFDAGIFGRNTALGSQASVRELLAYGFTLHLTVSFTLPAVVGDARLLPTRIQPGDDFDSTASFRFQPQSNEGWHALREHSLRRCRRSWATGGIRGSRSHEQRAGNVGRRCHGHGVAE